LHDSEGLQGSRQKSDPETGKKSVLERSADLTRNYTLPPKEYVGNGGRAIEGGSKKELRKTRGVGTGNGSVRLQKGPWKEASNVFDS